MVGDEPYQVRGINYYPAQYPWRRFLTETDLDIYRTELALLKETGINTLRIFLWNEALFNCHFSGAVPNWGTFQRLDGIIRIAGNLDFRLIVTLNDLPDLTDYPLYENPDHIVEQTAFVVERYRDEAAILAWDLRNEGDIDYGAHNTLPGMFRRQEVLDWLELTSEQVRALEIPQLITVGWLMDSVATAPFVDFISFHHWSDVDNLVERIVQMREATDKPILLQEFGYSTGREAITPEIQSDMIRAVIDTSEQEQLLGWMIWTAFDFPREATCFPSPCLSENNAEHYFGIWHSDYTPKPAALMLVERLRND